MKKLPKSCTSGSLLAGLTDKLSASLARRDPNKFAEFAFTDGEGAPLRPAPVHRELERLLGDHARAMVELPRDHGKSVQVGICVLWELGRRPGLRVKLVCATEALAIERGRFLRQAIHANPCVHLVFPHLRALAPWSVE